jgi:hypothetical protein
MSEKAKGISSSYSPPFATLRHNPYLEANLPNPLSLIGGESLRLADPLGRILRPGCRAVNVEVTAT